jgi:hypothetical protein
MLVWHRRLWLIDHGSSLYFHHSPGWETDTGRARAAFPAIRDHVLLKGATLLEQVDEEMAAALTEEVLGGVVALVPGEWLSDRSAGDPAAAGAAYRTYLLGRLMPPRRFVEEALRVR